MGRETLSHVDRNEPLPDMCPQRADAIDIYLDGSLRASLKSSSSTIPVAVIR